LLNSIYMGAGVASVAKIICFRCRRSDCGCLASGGERAEGHATVAWAVAWLGGACVAGTAVGAALALIFGG
jgi:hypothetical protein